MGQTLGTVAAAIGVFAGTDVDDLIVLAVLFTSARAVGVPRAWQIWAGQYSGIAVLVAVSVAAVTIANGADNISVYTPLFRTIGLGDTIITIGVFAVLVAVWCAAGSWLGSHRKVVAIVQRFGHWIVPVVFMLIGGFIVVQSGVLTP